MVFYGPPTEEEREKLNHPPRSRDGRLQLMEMRLEEEYGVNPESYTDEEMEYLFEQIEDDVEDMEVRRDDLEMQIRTLEEYLAVLRPQYDEVMRRKADDELERLTDERGYPDKSE